MAAACQVNTEIRNENVNQPAANSAANTKQPEATPPVAEKPSAGSMATPTEAYKTAYATRYAPPARRTRAAPLMTPRASGTKLIECACHTTSNDASANQSANGASSS